VQKDDDFSICRAGFDIVPKNDISISWPLDKMVCECHAIEDLSIALFVWFAGFDVGKMLDAFLNHVFLGHKIVDDFLGSVRQWGVLKSIGLRHGVG
jgi:hypothetical protein